MVQGHLYAKVHTHIALKFLYLKENYAIICCKFLNKYMKGKLLNKIGYKVVKQSQKHPCFLCEVSTIGRSVPKIIFHSHFKIIFFYFVFRNKISIL